MVNCVAFSFCGLGFRLQGSESGSKYKAATHKSLPKCIV